MLVFPKTFQLGYCRAINTVFIWVLTERWLSSPLEDSKPRQSRFHNTSLTNCLSVSMRLYWPLGRHSQPVHCKAVKTVWYWNDTRLKSQLNGEITADISKWLSCTSLQLWTSLTLWMNVTSIHWSLSAVKICKTLASVSSSTVKSARPPCWEQLPSWLKDTHSWLVPPHSLKHTFHWGHWRTTFHWGFRKLRSK